MFPSAYRIILALAVLLATPLFVHAQESTEWTTRETALRFTYEEISLPGSEKLGLAGGNYLLQVTPWLQGGIGVYGAVSGERGGFLTGGLEASATYPLLGQLSLGAGLFLGGGGGGAAPQGGGFMVRPHGELLYNAGFGTIGLGISHVRFPNGDISSTQAAVTCQFPLTAVMAQGWKQEAPPSLAPGTPATAGGRRYLLNYRHLYPGNDVKAIDGTRNTESLGLLGAELQQRVTDNLHVGISVAGAVAGNADGYAQLLMGAGVEFPVRERTALTAGVAIGAGGGGKIDTGGGLLAQGEVGLRYHLDDGWAMGLSAGYLVAPDGSFRATQVGAALSYGPSANKGSAAPLFAGRWRIRGGVQSYVPSGTIRYADAGEDDAIDLVAVKIDRFLDNGFYATGQALAACDGGAGGYAVGLVGLGWSTPLAERSPFFAMGELLMGAGGGGNVDSGSGLLLQPMAGIGWQINSRTDLILSGGFVTAPNGRLAVPVADAAIAWRFSTLESR